jgi:phosphohistidine phosphatase
VIHLWLLRHAKAEVGESGQSDASRILSGRGRRQMAWQCRHGMAVALAAGAVAPERVLVSTAARTRQTATLFGPALSSARIDHEAWLYDADGDDVVDRLRLVEDVSSVMVVGHNPTMEELALRLADDVPPTGPPADGLPTAGLVVLAFDVPDWTSVADHGGQLVSVAVPPRR